MYNRGESHRIRPTSESNNDSSDLAEEDEAMEDLSYYRNNMDMDQIERGSRHPLELIELIQLI